METAEWWVQTADGKTRPARMRRYAGYMAFEREMATVRMNQRQMDFWLPPCHPYVRKIVCLELARGEDASAGEVPYFLEWMDAVRSGFRFVGALVRPDGGVAAAIRAGGGPFHVDLNAVPVLQTAVQESIFYPPFPRLGSQYAQRLSGASDIFAAVAHSDNVAIPASMFRVPTNDPLAKQPDVQIQFTEAGASTMRVKLYYNSIGQENRNGSDTPSALTWTPLRFDVPYRAIGGVTVGGPENRAEWVRTAWYHSVLRPPLLTEADIVEIIRQRKGALGDLLRFRYATREIRQDPDEGRWHWRSYLWPSIVAKEDYFDARYGEIPAANYIPLIQSLRLSFERAPTAQNLPGFLLADVANYLASVLSQYFVMACFRVEGRVV